MDIMIIYTFYKISTTTIACNYLRGDNFYDVRSMEEGLDIPGF